MVKLTVVPVIPLALSDARKTAMFAISSSVMSRRGWVLPDSAGSANWLAENVRAAVTLRRNVPSARILVLPDAGHDVFRTNEAEVLREMRAFISTLR